jgi:aldehyde dehydrogenase (NAD+)
MPTRLLLPRSRYDEGVAILQAMYAGIVPGDPQDPGTLCGPVISARQRERVLGYIQQGVDEGARLVVGGTDAPEGRDRGFWVRPTLFADVDNAMTIAQEEIFGPVLSVLTFRTPEEAVEKANNTAYGLSAGVWTEKGSRILWMAERLRAGVVWANTFNRFDPASPFGGYKESGFGREGGRHGLEPYLRFD